MSGQMVLPHVVIANNMSEQNKYFLVLYPSEKRQVSITGLNKYLYSKVLINPKSTIYITKINIT
jgi:hypothetical protein